jgi:hypothetical protein
MLMVHPQQEPQVVHLRPSEILILQLVEQKQEKDCAWPWSASGSDEMTEAEWRFQIQYPV